MFSFLPSDPTIPSLTLCSRACSGREAFLVEKLEKHFVNILIRAAFASDDGLKCFLIACSLFFYSHVLALKSFALARSFFFIVLAL